MIQVRQALGGSVVALLKVTPEQATAYASTAVEVLPIPEGVDLEDIQGATRRLQVQSSGPPVHLRPVLDAAQQPVGDTGCAARA